MISVKQDNSQKTEQLTKKTWEDLRLSCFGSEYKMVEHFTRFMIASNCFQSSYCTKVRAGAKKKVEGRVEGKKRILLSPRPHPPL